MEKINNVLGSDNKKISNEEYLKIQLDGELMIEGNLNIQDGIECVECKNRGYIPFISENNTIVMKDCKCKKARNTIMRLKRSGISKTMLDKYTFGNYLVENEMQKIVKEKATEYYKIANVDNSFWFVICGQSGSGKSHICTALFQNIITNKYLNGEYLLWTKDINRLITLSKNFSKDSQEQFESEMKRLSECDVLYIDDFLKQTNYKEAYSMAYQIINDRYNNNKITIISSEYNFDELNKLDSAVAGRINEKTLNQKYWLYVTPDDKKNYRLKGN